MVFLLVFWAAGASSVSPVQRFGTYRTFFDDLSQRFRRASNAITVATNSFADGELATTLYVAKLRGARVQVAQWAGQASHFRSRSTYLKQVGVAHRTYAPALAGEPTLVCVDGKGWVVSTTLDSSWKWPVIVTQKAGVCQELAALWANGSSAKVPTAAPPRKPAPSARVKTSGKKGLPRETRWQQLQKGTATHDELGPMPQSAPVAPPNNESDLL